MEIYICYQDCLKWFVCFISIETVVSESDKISFSGRVFSPPPPPLA